MINVEKINGEEFNQCASCAACMKSTEDIYQIEVGQTKQAIILCHDCLMDLGNQIYEIYHDSTDFIDEKE